MPDTTTHGTAIEWTHVPGYRGETWNAIVGCSPDSTGCLNCYAAQLAGTRLRNRPEYAGLVTMRSDGAGGQRAVYNGTVRWVPERLDAPLHWREPRAVFVGDMTDIFHDHVPTFALDRLFAVMARTPQHLYLLLTKRPHRMRAYLTDPETGVRVQREMDALAKRQRPGSAYSRPQTLWSWMWPLRNVWLGTSAENQATAEARIPHLLATPAAVRFLSYEPALGPVELDAISEEREWPGQVNALTGEWWPALGDAEQEYRERIEGGRLHWVIAGGESGPGARPPHPQWFRDVRDQCAEAGVPFFFKQWGVYEFTVSGSDMQDYVAYEADDEDLRDNAERCQIVVQDGGRTAGPELARREWWAGVSLDVDDAVMRRVGKKAAGRLLDGRLHNAFPEVRRRA